uniref:Uncharacterized protein n=1 Tax=Brassica oleracea TaxID=3712 RepID=A0A3P6EYD2_BRAOL|nr:unnamed protein product [Brassica oleracea]
MGHRHPQISSVDVDGYGWTTLEMLNLWGHENTFDVNHPCIQKEKHCDGRWRICFNIRHVRALKQIVRSPVHGRASQQN